MHDSNSSSGYSILVVDDDSSILELLNEVLSSAGFFVKTTCSVNEAISVVESEVFDLILLDYILPDGNGLDFIKTTTKNSIAIPQVIMLTSANDEETIGEAFANGIVDFMPKPINTLILIHRVVHHLNNQVCKIELNEKQHQLDAVNRISQSAYWEYYPENRTVLCTKELNKMIGYGKEQTEVHFDDFIKLVHPNDRSQFAKVVIPWSCLVNEKTIDVNLVSKNGEILNFMFSSEIVHTYNNQYKISGVMHNITEQRKHEEIIKDSYYYDRLTSLPNRTLLSDTLDNLMNYSDKNEHLLGVFYIGIDRFKQINDSLGYENGNLLLVAISKRLGSLDVQCIARVSGDVFAVITNYINTAAEIEEKLEIIGKLFKEPFVINENEIYLTVSVGVTMYPFTQGNVQKILQHTESAMHKAKEEGGNREQHYHSGINKTFSDRLNLEMDIRKAIVNNEFELHYQPQISVLNRRIIGAEALIRWKHPERGYITPDQFIPVAEDTGIIIDVGQWVLDEALIQHSYWLKYGLGLLKIGVNISPGQFTSKHFTNKVQDIIDKTGLTPCGIDFEITESCAMNDITTTLKVLNELSEIGIQTSIDDFGTGYSSLSYLKSMALQTLKIDRTFIKDIDDKGKNGELAKMIISLTHTLGMNVIAEGVETEAHMNFLLEHDCAEAQGFYISKPLPAIEFEKLLFTNMVSQEKSITETDRVVLF